MRNGLLAWGVAASLLSHATLLALSGQRAPRTERVSGTALSVRLLAAPKPALRAAAPPPPAKVAPQGAARRSATRKPMRRPDVAAPDTQVAVEDHAPAAAAPAPSEAIDGSVFSLPRIGFGGGASPRWLARANSAPEAQPIPPDAIALMMHAQAHAAREAGLARMVQAVEQQLRDAQASGDASDAGCVLPAPTDAPTGCDIDARQQLASAPAATDAP